MPWSPMLLFLLRHGTLRIFLLCKIFQQYPSSPLPVFNKGKKSCRRHSHSTDKSPVACHNSDSLARHNAIHQTSASPQKITPSPRVAKACSFCAKQRLRCDGKEPCGRCHARGLQCIYLPRAKRRTPSGKWPAAADPSPTAVDSPGLYRAVRGSMDGSSGSPTGPSPWEAGKVLFDYRTQMRPHPGENGVGHEHLLTESERARYDSILQMTPDSALSSGDFPPLQRYDMVQDGTAGLPAEVHEDAARMVMDDTTAFFTDFDPQFSIWDWMAADFWALDQNLLTTTTVDPTNSIVPDPTIPLSNLVDQNLSSFHPQQELEPPRAPPNPQWPTEWNPTKQDNLIRFPDMTNIPTSMLDAEDFAHVEPMTPACYDKISTAMNKFADGHGPFRSFSNANMASIEVFSVFVQLFWEYFAPTFPIIHHGTFDTGETGWQLVLATATVGCRYSRLPGAAQYAVCLQELLRRVVASSVEGDNSQARELWFAQCVVLGNVGMIYGGTRRSFEIGEVTRNTMITISRRNGSLTSTVGLERIRRDHPDASHEQLWRLWAKEEMKRRLGFAVFILDSCMSLYFGLNPCMAVQEIKQLLPAHERIWNSSTASEWISQYQFTDDTPTAHATIKLAQRGALPTNIGSFSHHILVLTTYRHAIHIRDMAWQNPLFTPHPSDPTSHQSHHHPTTSDLSRSAVSVLESLHSSHPSETDDPDPTSAFTTHRLLVLLLLHVPQTDLVRFAATFDGWDWHAKDHRRLMHWMREDEGRTARTAVAYAGGLLARIRQKANYSTFDDPPAALTATLVLWTYNKLLQGVGDVVDEFEGKV
ncbi:fungal-specific transcription factor domain-containing protein [Podospora aff. communis PSN243]|uniref:Fungal-specific transcription factor domain-containing protein n=1 Tax=Podospora aff. communis PSN243 TaxID=3040156 RepID=A0AAV9GKK7_9PEZI|nr:fungal-specific transcription factor domain-containing protein [Podospora aff. communis PSN243]